MEHSNQPQPVEYYGSIWFNLIFGLFALAVGGFCVYMLTLALPGIVQPGGFSSDFVFMLVAVPAMTAFWFYGAFMQLRRVFVPKPEFRLDSNGITAFSRSGDNEFVPWSDTGPMSIGWTYGRTPTRYLKLELKGGKERDISDLLLTVSLEELQTKIIEFQKAYGACAPKELQGPDNQRAEKIGLSGWIIGIGEVIATLWG